MQEVKDLSFAFIGIELLSHPCYQGGTLVNFRHFEFQMTQAWDVTENLQVKRLLQSFQSWSI